MLGKTTIFPDEPSHRVQPDTAGPSQTRRCRIGAGPETASGAYRLRSDSSLGCSITGQFTKSLPPASE